MISWINDKKRILTNVQILRVTMGLLTKVRGSWVPPALAPPKAPPYPPWSITGPHLSEKTEDWRKTTTSKEALMDSNDT